MVDIWGLGVMIYEMFWGKTPFVAATEMLTYNLLVFNIILKMYINITETSYWINYKWMQSRQKQIFNEMS